MISKSLQNELLSTRLRGQKVEAEQVRLIQYILTRIIILLVAILTGGYLWRRGHYRRLRRLFDLLISHHVAWLLIRDSLPLISRPQIKLPGHSEASTEVVTKADNLPYQRTLLVTEEQKLFLNSNLGLMALSCLVGINRTQLSTILNRQTGTDFSCWPAEYRVYHLLLLVALHPDSDITILVSESDLTSRTSFSRQSRQVTGLTPNQYKNVRKETSK